MECLKKWGLYDNIYRVFAKEIDGIKKKTLFELSILLHDLGKIVVFNVEKVDREHEFYSKELLSNDFLKKKFMILGLTKNQINYISRCIETHDLIGKEVRDKLKRDGNLNFNYVLTNGIKYLCDNISEKNRDIKVEIGIFFLCDLLAKTDIRIDADTDDEILQQESKIVKTLKERGLSSELKHAALQLSINLKIAEIYLKSLNLKLEEKALELRKKVLDLSLETGDAHLGGSFSEIEILISIYEILKEDDKFILSKGHACFPHFILLREKGYSPKIMGHPEIDIKNKIYCTTGSLGHGLPIGVGMALARKLKNKKGRIYILMSDGECQEGTTWESSLIASHHKLDNLIVILDYNKIQALDKIENILSLNNLRKKFESFGWYVTEVDGHNFSDLVSALQLKINKPHMIVAHTTKGKGVSFIENNPEWHSKRPTPERLNPAYEELNLK